MSLVQYPPDSSLFHPRPHLERRLHLCVNQSCRRTTKNHGQIVLDVNPPPPHSPPVYPEFVKQAVNRFDSPFWISGRFLLPVKWETHHIWAPYSGLLLRINNLLWRLQGWPSNSQQLSESYLWLSDGDVNVIEFRYNASFYWNILFPWRNPLSTIILQINTKRFVNKTRI